MNLPRLYRPPRLHRKQQKKTPSKGEELVSRPASEGTPAAGSEGTFVVKVKQFLFPSGEEQDVKVKLPIDVAAPHKEMTDAGFHFVADFLTRLTLTASITNGKKHTAIREIEVKSIKRVMADMLIEGSWK